ncbi:hypothetical protein BCR42DRAFT_209545 [Absidia repens]|uniref:Uncharacterized protein n=1 Tax=Absidia repens TaxID=90262 RepID=A0A1X2IQI7_9FUNG|nr:hypothetical protein BCR42DRAFT_209545 [Absidia repens]
MKVQALVLGKYDTTATFRLYRFPVSVSPPLNSPISTSPTMTEAKLDRNAMYYYCLEDLERLAILSPASTFRHVNTVQLYRDNPSAFCKM